MMNNYEAYSFFYVVSLIIYCLFFIVGDLINGEKINVVLRLVIGIVFCLAYPLFAFIMAIGLVIQLFDLLMPNEFNDK